MSILIFPADVEILGKFETMKKGQPSKITPLTQFIGTPGRIRTCGLRIRSPALYPAELRAHAWTGGRAQKTRLRLTASPRQAEDRIWLQSQFEIKYKSRYNFKYLAVNT